MNTEITDIRNENGSLAFNPDCSLAAHSPRRFTSLLLGLGLISTLLPIALALSLGRTLPAWIWMWLIALALFLGAKCLTILWFLRSAKSTAGRRLLAYAFAWPGMDIHTFCGNGPVAPPLAREWALAAMKTICGATMIWLAVRLTRGAHPLIIGWIGMSGIVLLFHFGMFHLLSLLWRTFGIDARPIMHSPAAATSLSRFWGGSWNAAFTDLMHHNVFKPLSHNIGLKGALLLVFLISGALHELVISVPAHGGYGLPTAYFVLQGLALLAERSEFGRKLGLGSGFKGWCLVALVAGVPAFWLFHPVFIHNVILPLLRDIGAT